jgi:hypothetical protein
VVDGRITVPDGPSYAVMVLPKQSVMRPEVAQAIQRLVHDGAVIVGPKPFTSPSLAGYPACDQAVQAIASEVWGDVDGGRVTRRKVGKGTLYNGLELDQVLLEIGLQPDVRVESSTNLLCAAAGAGQIGIEKRGGIVFKHRAAPDCEVYFLANTSDKPAEFTASLRVARRRPELWNADTGEIIKAAAFRQENERTLIPLRLEPSESVFVVLGETIAADSKGTAASNTPQYPVAVPFNGPWTVRFDGQGAPAETVFASLTDWAQHPDDAIKHYAGTAVYETSFTLAELVKNKRTVLELGVVGVIADVRVNDQEAGTVWTSPWRLDISRFITSGRNSLQVRVANTWNNRLVADAPLPTAQRQSYVSQPYRFTPKERLLKGGLIGPVHVKQEN